MFQTDDYVVHNNSGICQVKEIVPLNIPGADKNRKYYLLIPIGEKGSKVYVPTDVEGSIRPILSDEEAWKLIDAIPEIEEMWIDNDKLREAKYKEAIRSNDCRELVKIIKNLYLRRSKRLQEGKKNTATDDKYFKIAEENLYSELAFAIGKEKSKMREIITERIK